MRVSITASPEAASLLGSVLHSTTARYRESGDHASATALCREASKNRRGEPPAPGSRLRAAPARAGRDAATVEPSGESSGASPRPSLRR